MSDIVEKSPKRFIVFHGKCHQGLEQGPITCHESQYSGGSLAYVMDSCQECSVDMPKFMTWEEAEQELADLISRDFSVAAYIFELVKTEHPQSQV